MLNKEIKKMLDEQINMEMYSAYLYHQIQYRFEDMELDGFADWFEIQAEEEMSHAKRIEDYLKDIDESICFSDIAADIKIPSDVRKILELALTHEKKVSASIEKIYTAAKDLNDYRTVLLLDWFITEQIEEEDNARYNIKKFDMIGNDPLGLYELDKYMGKREG